jgi:tRNA (guanine10-N2)-dimethyltransferase
MIEEGKCVEGVPSARGNVKVTCFGVCIRQPGNELIAAECEALTGQYPEPDGFFMGGRVSEVPRSAYLRYGASLLASGQTLDDLVDRITGLNLDAEAFRIEVHRLAGAIDTQTHDVIVAVANGLRGAWPNLSAPKHRFVALVRSDGFWFGELLTEAERSWKRHEVRPEVLSCSLPSRLSRALVNLAAGPAGILLNPCCGAGSLLLEAASIGATGYGIDWNARMVEMSRKNLEFFDYVADVRLADACSWTQRGDVVVADLPYDVNCRTTEKNVGGIVAQALTLAPQAIFVAAADLSPWLLQAGYRRIGVYRVRDSADFARFVHWGETP